MAAAGITNTGNSTIDGDVSLDPLITMTGFPPGVVNGTTHLSDEASVHAKADLLIAYNYAKGLPAGIPVGTADLGQYNDGHGLGVFLPGTYESGSTMSVATNVVLDGGGNPSAVWVFKIGSALTTTTGNISLANEAQAKNVFWVPTTSATIGGGTTFYGTIIAGVSITCNTSARIYGRALAGAIDNSGAVTLDTNHISVPTP
jgi:hypothetical protein